jgi:hypothetical protein
MQKAHSEFPPSAAMQVPNEPQAEEPADAPSQKPVEVTTLDIALRLLRSGPLALDLETYG